MRRGEPGEFLVEQVVSAKGLLLRKKVWLGQPEAEIFKREMITKNLSVEEVAENLLGSADDNTVNQLRNLVRYYYPEFL